MALVTWQQTFKDGVDPLKNAAIYVYLANTTSPAMVWDSNSVIHQDLPQLRTDITGYVKIYFDETIYQHDTAYDIVCEPDPMFNPTAETQYLTGQRPLATTGTIKDDKFELDLDLVAPGRQTWNTGDDRIYLEWITTNTLQFRTQTDAGADLNLGTSGNQFDTIMLHAETWIRLHANGLRNYHGIYEAYQYFYMANDDAYSLKMDTSGFYPITQNSMGLGLANNRWKNIYTCNAVTVTACSPAPPMAMDVESVDAIIEDIKAIKPLLDEKGDPIIGDHGFPQIDLRTLPQYVTNKADLYQEIRARGKKKWELENKLAGLMASELKNPKEIESVQIDLSTIKADAKEDLFWEDFNKGWDEGVYNFAGAGMKADPVSLIVATALVPYVESLKARIEAIENAKPAEPGTGPTPEPVEPIGSDK